ncbi:MAG TPA: transposase [Anaerolineae bacterium]|nr:transposase [Anaerolineae bacterium]
MTTEWRPDFDPAYLYFITTTAAQRLPLFQRDVTKRLLIDTLDCMRLRGRFKLYAFVVMPNHIHLIIQCKADDPYNNVMRDFKKHVADRLIRQLEAEDNQPALARLAGLVTCPGRQQYAVWEEGYLAKAAYSAKFIDQKITYIHNNPCQPHWHLAENASDYLWSSARFYLSDARSIIPVDDVRLVLA